MKKFLSLVCAIICVLSLTACGKEVVYTDYEQQKIDNACSFVTGIVVPAILDMTGLYDDENDLTFENFTLDELSYLIQYTYAFDISGYAMRTACDSFSKTLKEVGDVEGIGNANATIDDDTIIVKVEVLGSKRDAVAEVIVSNDFFNTVKSAALNIDYTFGEQMKKGALNTAVGMLTVFLVLILIMFIIMSFGLINKLEKKKADSKKTVAVKETPATEAVEATDYSDDLELVAVISAAIAAFEGNSSTDGFVVRSIKKHRR